MAQTNLNMKSITCISDFEKAFYPKLFKEKNIEAIENPKVLGSKLAERSLKKIKYKLSKDNL